MKRNLFCEIHPVTYKLSLGKERLRRHIINNLDQTQFAKSTRIEKLDYRVYKHRTLLLRKLGNSDIRLQMNKKENMKKIIPLLNGIIIGPGQTFSFWQLVGKCSKRKGFLEGVTIKNGKVVPGIAGGMCQMTNLIHWLVLHSSLEITEHHHHHRYDLFPDYNRQIPFGTGTSIMHNYLDYRFYNPTNKSYQLKIHLEGDYLVGALYASQVESLAYHIEEHNHHFIYENKSYYRCNEIYRKVIDKRTGNTLENTLLLKNKSRVCYDKRFIDQSQIVDW